MTDKIITFAVDNVRLVNENKNSKFALLSLDFFASGANRHDTYISEETLARTAPSIKNCPLIWRYDKRLDDAYTHGEDQTPCGFVPDTAEIQSRVLADGRTMLSVTAYVWKRYTGEILSFFKRDGGSKPISVEMSISSVRELPNGLVELLDFTYEGITILGSYITPAIPSAEATVLSFAKEYNTVLKEEFAEDLIQIPAEIFSLAKTGLVTYASTSLAPALSLAKTFSASQTISKPNLSYIVKRLEQDPETYQNVFGGESVLKWCLGYFANEGVREMSDVYSEEAPQDAVAPEEFAPPAPATEEPEGDKPVSEEPGETDEKKEFAFPENFSAETMMSLFAEEEEEFALLKGELDKGKFADPALVMSAMFSKMCKMSKAMEEMSVNSKAYMADNEELKKFKADIEESRKEFAVNQTLRELSEKVIIPDEARLEMVREAENYSLENLDGWKTFCKAKSFDFAVAAPKDGTEGPRRMALPVTGTSKKSPGDDNLWAD